MTACSANGLPRGLASIILALGGLSLAAFFRRRLQVASWLRGNRDGQQRRMSRALRVLLSADADHPLVFEDALLDLPETNDYAPSASPMATARMLDSGDRYTWLLQNGAADFSARYAHAAVFNTKEEIFVFGGATADLSGYLNDVWSSKDHGVTWQWVIPRSDKFSPRRGHAAVMNYNKIVMFVLGGFCGKDCFMNDWWSSEFGDVWQKLGDSPWSARHGHAAVMTSDETLVLMGGHDGLNYLNDIWSIRDPEQATASSTWLNVRVHNPNGGDSHFSPRYGHAVVINSRNHIIILGGFFADKKAGEVLCYNDVWHSGDIGASWELIVEHAPWSGRYQHTALIGTNDEMFVIGGLSVDLERCNDAWRSKDDGFTWDAVTPSAPWVPRYEHASVIDFNNSLYVLGGMNTGAEKFHDVWRAARSCFDEVDCGDAAFVCRDSTYKNFHQLSNPICVGICDRKIYDKCTHKQACRVQNDRATCVDPCDEISCTGKGEVCEVYARGNELHDVILSDAEAYCLACGDSRTKFACDKLRQCKWSPGDEACQMRCKVATSEKKCKSIGGSCKWKDDKCGEKK